MLRILYLVGERERIEPFHTYLVFIQGSSPKPVQNRNSGPTFESLIQSIQDQHEGWREDSVNDSDPEPVPDTSPEISDGTVTATEHSDEMPLSCIAADRSAITNEQQGWTESEFDEDFALQAVIGMIRSHALLSMLPFKFHSLVLPFNRTSMLLSIHLHKI